MGADNLHKLEGKFQEQMAHEVVEDGIDEVGVHEGGNNSLAFAFAEFLGIELEMGRSQLQKFVPEKNQELP